MQELMKVSIADLQKTQTQAELFTFRLSAEYDPIGANVQDVVFP